MADVVIKIEELKKLISLKLVSVGVDEKEASIVSDVLSHSDARGVRSHGTIRIEHYVNRIKNGGININPKLEFKLTGKCAALVDVQGALGHVGMHFATTHAIKKVADNGLFVVSIQNASHCGPLSYYVDMALNAKLIAMVFVNTDKCVVPFGGGAAFFGTNPIAFGFPGKEHRILIDMATSEVAFGKIFSARESKSEIPSTWGIDENGSPTTDPFKVVAVNPMASHKGTAIATAVEGFTGFFTGAFGPHIKSMYGDITEYRNTGAFIFLMEPGLFGDASTYFKSTDNLYKEIKELKRAPGVDSMYVAGEPEDIKYQNSLRDGVLIYQNIYDYLKS